MNIFVDPESLHTRIPPYKVFDALDGFLPLARKVRMELGGQAHLLDTYLPMIF